MAQYIRREDVLDFIEIIRPCRADYFNAGITEERVLNRVEEIVDELERLQFVEIQTEDAGMFGQSSARTFSLQTKPENVFCKINGAPCNECNPSCVDNKSAVW